MRKLGRPTDQRMAILRNQASYLLWYGKIETTLQRAKEVQSYAEKLITTAINAHTDVVKVPKVKKDDKGKEIAFEMINDGPQKLNARRKLMAKLYEIPEVKAEKEKNSQFKARTKHINHPLIEKIFNEIAPKYAQRADDLKQGGGYTRIIRTGERRGDAADMAILELV